MLYLDTIRNPTAKNVAEYTSLKKYIDDHRSRDFTLEHTKPLFNKHNILSMRCLYISRTITELFKILKYRLPMCLFSCFQFSVRSNYNKLLPPKCVLGISMNNFVFRASSMWNKCIGQLLSTPSLTDMNANIMGNKAMLIIPGSTKDSDLTCAVPVFKMKLKSCCFYNKSVVTLLNGRIKTSSSDFHFYSLCE